MDSYTERTGLVDKKKCGFAVMDPERRKEVASKGGKAAHANGAGHRFTPEEAKAAGRKGGIAKKENANRDT